jgi:predicted O-methyltransferase YrrM
MNTIGKGIYDGITPSGIDAVQGWNSTDPTFAHLIEEVRPQTIIEVGSWLGASAIHMAKECRRIGLWPQIYCVDTWLGATEFWTDGAGTEERDLRQRNGYPQIYFDFLANVAQAGMQTIITPIPNTSTIGAKILRHHGVIADLVYIDGSHDFEDVVQDIRSYAPLVRQGGILFGDDLNWPGVSAAVSQEIGEFRTEGFFWISQR